MTLLPDDRPFYTFVREERQFSFLLAHFLMQKGPALRLFFELVRGRLPDPNSLPQPTEVELDGAEVYVEFAELRDRWNGFLVRDEGEKRISPAARLAANARKRDFIATLVSRIPSLTALDVASLPSDPATFNAHFMGEAGKRITRDIASPALWPVAGLAQRFGTDTQAFLDLCKLKWSFHIKPDLVIRVAGQPSICVEAKLESGEGTYPVGQEAKLFDSMFEQPVRVRQFELQKFMFASLLQERCQPVIIQKLYPQTSVPASSGAWAPATLIWGEVFSTLMTDGLREQSIPFVGHLVAENSSLLSSYAQHRMWGGG